MQHIHQLIIIIFTRKDCLNNIRILQWNCCGIRGKLPYLQHIGQHYDILCMQDTLLYPQSVFRLGAFQAIRKDSKQSGQRGICILIRNSLSFNHIDTSALQHSSVEIQGISIDYSNSKEQLIVLDVYRHPNSYTPQDWFDKISQMLMTARKVLVVGDFNAHHAAWGCTISDRAGRMLLNTMDEVQACIINDGKSTLLTAPGSNKSVIDITIASAELAVACEVVTDEDTGGSDHFPLNISIDDSLGLRHVFLHKLTLDKSKEKMLYSRLTSTSDAFFREVPKDAVGAYEFFAEHLRSATRSLLPEKSHLPRMVPAPSERKHPPWWTLECSKAILDRREAARAYQRCPSLENFLAFKKTRAVCSRRLYKTKRSQWKKLVDSFDCKIPTAEIWLLVKTFMKRNLADSSMISDSGQQRNLLVKAIYKICPPFCCPNSNNSLES